MSELFEEVGRRARALALALGVDAKAASWQRVLSRGTEGRTVVLFAYPGGIEFVAKLCPPSEAAAEHRALLALAAVDLRVLRVPRPLSFEPDLGLLLMESVPGRVLSSGAASDVAPASRLVGRALSELHRITVPGLARKVAKDHVAELVRPSFADLSRLHPIHEEVFAATLSALEGAQAAWERTEEKPAVIHRDVHLRQLLTDGHGVWLLDWDRVARGDPAFDVAYLEAHLETHLPPECQGEALARFREGYGPKYGALEARLPPWRRFNYVRRAARRLRLQDEGWEAEFQRMMARARRAQKEA